MIAPLVSLVLLLATASPVVVHAWVPHDTTGRRITPNLRGRGQAIEYAYDFTHLVGIDYPGGDRRDVAYTWGAPGAPAFGAGRIVGVEDASGSERRRYDALGQLVREERTIWSLRPGVGDATYTTRYRYDTWGRGVRDPGSSRVGGVDWRKEVELRPQSVWSGAAPGRARGLWRPIAAPDPWYGVASFSPEAQLRHTELARRVRCPRRSQRPRRSRCLTHPRYGNGATCTPWWTRIQ